MRGTLIISIVAALFALLQHSVLAASSQWQDLGGGKARLLATMDPQSKAIKAAVEVQLEPGWSTYWRYPGSSGIPPRFDFSKSRGFLVEETYYPAPSLISPDHEPYAGYKGRVVFPMLGRLDASANSKMDLHLLIGVCATVCIPAQAQFSISASQLLRSDPLAAQVISGAMETIPEKADASRLILTKTMGAPNELHITLAHDGAEPKSHLFVEGPSEWYLTPARLVKSEGGASVFSLDVSRAPAQTDVVATPLIYTLVTQGTGIEFRD